MLDTAAPTDAHIPRAPVSQMVEAFDGSHGNDESTRQPGSMHSRRPASTRALAPSIFVAFVLAAVPLAAEAASGANETKVCEASKPSLMGGDGGLLLPLFSSEPDWNTGFRAVLYLIGLLWSFLGVGLVADRFMMAIEVITAKEKSVTLPDGATVSVRTWNATVANLTLMALGSSAPEILLSVIEIISASFFSGELGPSTIVGSAAFNLFMIIAVCVVALPEGETRRIDDMGVYSVTAFFSLFAYLWLLVILLLFSPNVVEPWEGILTFLFFPVLVILAYGADRNWFSSAAVTPQQHVLSVNGGKMFHAYTCAELLKTGQLDKSVSPEEAAKMVARMASEKQKPSRAQLRMNAIRQMTGGKRVVSSKKTGNKPVENVQAAAVAEAVEDPKVQQVFFPIMDYAVLESDGKVILSIARSHGEGTVTVHYQTENDSATAGKDFEAVNDKVTFEAGETEKTVEVKIIDDDEVEEDENFKVVLTRVEASEGIVCTLRHNPETAVVTIIDDDEPGSIGFKAEHTAVTCAENVAGGFLEIVVSRMNGSNGTISCTVAFEDISAVSEQDYTPLPEEQCKITFESTQITKRIRIPILDTKSYDKTARFKVVLKDPEGVRAELAQYTECVITIVADEEMKKLVDTVTKMAALHIDKYKMGTSTWAEQFKDALIVGADEEDPDFEASTMDYVMHVLTVPWKLFFALIPPTDFGGGWYCFFIALGFIGVVTAIIGDLASIFGCLISLKDPVTAITFVALGTSLPDTFASKAAAIADDNADASIGNVTGSNSVNVFLGLGLPWTIASLYWAINGATDDWDARFPEKDYSALRKHYRGSFVVEAGSLGISVATFSCCACVCLATLYFRRVTYGAELGGPPGPAKATFALFAGLWFIYVLVSAIVEYSQ